MNKQEFKEKWNNIGEYLQENIPEYLRDLDEVIEYECQKAIADHEAKIGLNHPNVYTLLRRGYKSPTSCGLDNLHGVFELYEYISSQKAKFPDTTSEPLPDAYQPKEGGDQ